MKTFKRFFCVVFTVVVLVSILLGNYFATNNYRTSYQKNVVYEAQISHQCSFSKPGSLPFSETGCEASRSFEGFTQNYSINNFKISNLVRIIIDSQLSLTRFDNSNDFFAKSIAHKRLEGFFLFSLKKLLI